MELKQFPRIQTVVFSQNDFDGIQHFPECGGIGIFIGTVRNHHQGKAVKALKYTAYAPVAEKMIRQIEQEIQFKYGVSYVRVVHRIGDFRHCTDGAVASSQCNQLLLLRSRICGFSGCVLGALYLFWAKSRPSKYRHACSQYCYCDLSLGASAH